MAPVGAPRLPAGQGQPGEQLATVAVTPVVADVQPLTWQDFAGESFGSQLKTCLAMFGALSLLLWFSKRVAAVG